MHMMTLLIKLNTMKIIGRKNSVLLKTEAYWESKKVLEDKIKEAYQKLEEVEDAYTDFIKDLEYERKL